MRKHLLLLGFLYIMGNNMQAQYHRMTNDTTTKWCVAWNFIALRADEPRMLGYNYMIAEGDTTIGSYTYKQLWQDGSSYYGGLREDSVAQRVYFVHHSGLLEELIYDFSLGMGDNIVLDFHNNSMNNLHDGTYVVDSVGTVEIRGGTRKYIRLHNSANTNLGPNGRPYKIEWIESVGNIHEPVYNYMNDEFADIAFGSCGHYGQGVVINHELNGTRNYINVCAIENVFGDVSTDSCAVAYWSGIEEEGPAGKLGVYPNPVSAGNTVSVEATKNLPASVRITLTDISGRNVMFTTVQSNGPALRLNVPAIKQGVYLVKLENPNGELLGTVRLIIE